MTHSVLVDKLNKHKIIQYLFVILPILFVAIYIVAYLNDISSVLGVVTYNDSVAKDNLSNDVIKEVAGYTENDDGTYDISIVGDEEKEIEVNTGDPIYYVYAMQPEWFKMVVETEDGEDDIYSTVCDLVDDVKEVDDDTLEYTKNDKTYKIEACSLLATVILAKDGSYTIEYSDSDIEDETLDSLETLEVELATDSGYRFKFHDGYNVNIKDININFCSILPTDSIYYTESNKTFIKNISQDFCKTFIFTSNILVVIVSMIAYCVLLMFVRKRGDLLVLSKKAPFVYSILCIILVLTLIPLTFFLI